MLEKFVKIYGSDDSGSAEIELFEQDILEEKEFWTGRNWTFNENHGLWNMDNKEEKLSYQIGADRISDEGFRVAILNYNNLVDLFGLIV